MSADRKESIMRLAVAVLAAIAIQGCAGKMDELYSDINDVKARPGGRIEPLPQIEPYESFAYAAVEFRSPFVPDVPGGGPNADSGVRPDPTRIRQFLEEFPLDSLRMVGTMSSGPEDFGLVQTSDGLIHRVTVGSYMGQNDGHVVEISESQIRLVEIISDGLGGYMERPAAVALED